MAREMPIIDGVIDLDAARAHREGSEIHLTRLDVALLRCLADRAPEPVSRTELLVEVWELDPRTNTAAVEQEVRRLRTKIEADPRRPRHLQSVYGAGYRWVDAPESTG